MQLEIWEWWRASSSRRQAEREAAADGGGGRDGDAPVGAAATQGRAAGCAVLRGGARFQRKRLLREKGLIRSPSVIDSTFAAKQTHALLRLGGAPANHNRIACIQVRILMAAGVLSNRVDREDLAAGDHIYSWRAAYLYAHHGTPSQSMDRIDFFPAAAVEAILMVFHPIRFSTTRDLCWGRDGHPFHQSSRPRDWHGDLPGFLPVQLLLAGGGNHLPAMWPPATRT